MSNLINRFAPFNEKLTAALEANVSAALAEDIKIAVVGAMSGPVAQYGDQEFTGAEQAVADINAKGGIKGNKIDLYFDTYAECWDFGVRMCTVYILG